MANKRMFSLKIIDTDAFMDMPLSTQALYLHLAIRADDDGFVDNPKRIMKIVGCQEDDYKILIAKRFIIIFDSGVCVIKHWLIHNLIRSDRYNATNYLDEKAKLDVKPNKSYTEKENVIPDGNRLAPQVRLGKDSKGKDRLVTTKVEEKKYTDKDVELTKILYELVKTNFSFIVDRKTDIQLEKDYEEMNRLNRIDGRDYKTIEGVIRWSQQDEFWKGNIRSVSKLRKQFENLLVKIKGQVEKKTIADFDK